ncbi:MAG TPA: GWxTD domain-containing protein [Vicinamibacteria bacterium]|nr:GWxTD domain-containing protein [Vicinamibacteria bacterium]
MHALVGFLLAAGIAAPRGDDRIDKLPEHYRKWITEEVNYIISEVEREAFLALESEVEREAFLNAFWRKRDENPTTPENEYRIEHYERLVYVDNYFGRDTFRKGWQTDMGRYYILLGPPRTRHNFEGKDAIYPVELWFYNDADLKRLNLPPFFFLLFFRRHGTGEMELYSPIADGPESLLRRINTTSMDFRDNIERAYNDLRNIDPELAKASLSFRTDEGDIEQFSSPAFGTLSLLDDIRDAPFVGLDTSYAERLDFERGAVESDYLFTYVPSAGMVSVLPGPEDAAYLHWALELEAKNVAFVKDAESGNLASAFIVSMEIVPRDDPDRLVLQTRRESFVRLNPTEEPLLHRPFSYTGMTPVVPGDYTVRVILRNRACPSREDRDCLRGYTLLDGDVRIPDWPDDRSTLGDLVLGYEQEMQGGEPAYRAYRFGTVQIKPNPTGVFAVGDGMVAAIEPKNAPASSNVRFQLVDVEPGREMGNVLDETVPVVRSGPIVRDFSLERLESGRYRLDALLTDAEGREIDRKTTLLTVSPRTSIVRPGVHGSAPQVVVETPGVVAMALGEQYLALGELEKARARFEEALSANPKLGLAREHLARFEMDAGDSGRVVELLEPIYAEVKDRYEVLALLGQAYYRQENYASAAELLEKAIALRRPEASMLNVLASAHYRLGELSRAVELLKRSLELVPDQPEIVELLSKVEAERKASGQGSETAPAPAL